MAYDRYSNFRGGDNVYFVPFIPIIKKDSDIYIRYERGKKRLDEISYEYYRDPNYAWLIMQANPEYGSLEYDIKDNVLLRIPFPLALTLQLYNKDISKYFNNNL